MTSNRDTAEWLLVSSEILRRMAAGQPLHRIDLTLRADGEIVRTSGEN